jgi:hypothetical protein
MRCGAAALNQRRIGDLALDLRFQLRRHVTGLSSAPPRRHKKVDTQR